MRNDRKLKTCQAFLPLFRPRDSDFSFQPFASSLRLMKSILNALRYLTAIALAVLAVGCAGHLLDKENVAVAAGFKVITPTKPDQQALLRKLPADKVTRINHAGKTYYVLPDLQHNRAYVGGPRQYQAYLQLRQAQEKNSANAGSPPMGHFQVVEVNEVDWVGWDSWGGWDGLAEPGWY